LSCICQQCGKNYRIDLILPDDIWEKIKPDNKPEGGGLLCGSCIMYKLELLGKYSAISGNIDLLI